MTEDEKQLSRECGDNMEDDAFKKWYNSQDLAVPEIEDTFNAGYAQATKDIMERWPAYVDMQLAAPQIGRDQSQWHACYVWLKSKLFPEDEVK